MAYKTLVNDLKQKWEECETNHEDVFRYKLNVTKEKVLEGKFKFFVQVGKFNFEDFHFVM